MSEKKIMEFKITIDRSQISTMEKKGGKEDNEEECRKKRKKQKIKKN